MEKSLGFKIAILLLLVIGQGFEIFAQNVVPEKKEYKKLSEIRSDLKKRVDTGKIPSVSIGIFKKNQIIWRESFGFADKEKKIKANSDTIYALASLSKSITGTGIFKLSENKKINLKSPVYKYLKSASLKYYQGKPEGLKVYHLLNMVGGIPHHWHYFYDDSGKALPSMKEQIDTIGFVAFEPGKIHNYSNFSFAILDQIIADVSGQDFESYMEKNIFFPAGMANTYADRGRIPENKKLSIARGYDWENKPIAGTTFLPRGGAGFYSSVNDLLKYGLIHLGKSKNQILKGETLYENHRVLPGMPNKFYANGWGVIKTSEKRTTLLSNGAIAGAASSLIIIPEDQIIIAVLVNMTVGNDYTDKIAFDSANALFPGYMKNLNKVINENKHLFQPQKFKSNKSLSGLWRGFIKVDNNKVPFELRFSEKDQIRLSINNKREILVEAPNFENGTITGKFKFPFPAKKLNGKKYTLGFSLQHKSNMLNGIVQTTIEDERPAFNFPFYAELRKVLD